MLGVPYRREAGADGTVPALKQSSSRKKMGRESRERLLLGAFFQLLATLCHSYRAVTKRNILSQEKSGKVDLLFH